MDALAGFGILTERNVARFVLPDGAGLSEDGKRFVERLLTAAIVPDAEVLESARAGASSACWPVARRGSCRLLRAGAVGLAPAAVRRSERPGRHARPIDRVGARVSAARLDVWKARLLGNPTAEQLLILLFETQRKPTRFQAFAKQYAGYAARNPVHQTRYFRGSGEPEDGLERALQGHNNQ
jgi:hypothetical protein